MSASDKPTPPQPPEPTDDDWFVLPNRERSAPRSQAPRSRAPDDAPPSLGDDFVDGWFV